MKLKTGKVKTKTEQRTGPVSHVEIKETGDHPARVRVEIEVGLSRNYNSLKLRVGGEVPFPTEPGASLKDNLSDLHSAIETTVASLEDIVEAKIEEMQDVLGDQK